MADTHALGETERAFVVQRLTDAVDLAKAVAAAKNLRRVRRREDGEGLEAALAAAERTSLAGFVSEAENESRLAGG